MSSSVSSGLKSLIASKGRRYYVLEHKNESSCHRAGSSQRIIVDQIEMGRDPRCQVRFDESTPNVSRRHAAIVRQVEGGWKIIHLSQTNATYVNGREVNGSLELNSGDEIRLSANGPRMGFIVPDGDNGLVRSIGMGARITLFRQQAMQPYRYSSDDIHLKDASCGDRRQYLFLHKYPPAALDPHLSSYRFSYMKCA